MKNENEQTKAIPAQESQAAPKRKRFASWKRFFGKKWVFPAIYVAAAALILSVMWMIQDPNNYALTGKDLGIQVNQNEDNQSSTATETKPQDAVTVTSPVETMKWPVPEDVKVEKVMGFFDQAASENDRKAAMVEYQNRYWPHQGIDLAKPDGTTFDVTAALSGQVTRVVDDPMVGSLVEIQHQDGMITIYQSLADVKVSVGDEVRQGDVIAKAGRNLFERGEGVHVHFGVIKDGVNLSPESYILNHDQVNTNGSNAAADNASEAGGETQNRP